MDSKIAYIQSITPFIDWDNNPYFTEEFKTKTREIFKETIHLLIKLNSKCNAKSALPILHSCIRKFNDLKSSTGFYIDTETREEILRFFYKIIDAFELKYEYGFPDQFREW